MTEPDIARDRRDLAQGGSEGAPAASHAPLPPAAAPRPHGIGAAAMLFFRQFLASPKSVGSIIPTAQATIDALLAPIDWSRTHTLVEYGPGTGVFTRSILERASPHLRLIAIDPNPVFIDHLRTHLPDRRLVPVQGSAADVEAILAAEGRASADIIVSGLPFSTLPPGVGDAIMAATERALTPEGVFLVYQYSLFVLPMLKAHFNHVDVERAWRCIPPARLMRAWKSPRR